MTGVRLAAFDLDGTLLEHGALTRRAVRMLQTLRQNGIKVVIATGGMSTMMAAETACIDVVDKMLTLNGLEIIYEKNKALRTQKLVSQGSGTYDE